VIMIARGGGSTADLSWFDNKKIAETIAMLKFPLISAIGHEINTSITDMVAHTFVKTPTKGAQFIIERIKEFIDSLTNIEERLEAGVKSFLNNNKKALGLVTAKCESASMRYFQLHKEELSFKRANIFNFAKKLLSVRLQELLGSRDILKLKLNTCLSDSRERIEHIESKARILDPKNVLKRGYSITLKDSKPIKSIDDINENDIIKTVLYEGNISSCVKGKTKENEQESN